MPLCVHRVPLPLFTSRFIVQSLIFFVCLHVGKGVKTHFHYTETNGGLSAMKRFFVPVGVGYHEAGRGYCLVLLYTCSSEGMRMQSEKKM